MQRRPFARSSASDRECGQPELSLLVQAVEQEVIPRLLAAHKYPRRAQRMPTMQDVETICRHALDSDPVAARRHIDRLLADGVCMEAIYINLLGATARLLGEMWEKDEVGFVDVTVGLCALHQVLFKLAPDKKLHAVEQTPGRRALFAPVPGENHVFGALIVAKFFSRAGWQTWTEIAISPEMLTHLVGAEGFDVIGLSMSCDRHCETLTRTISELRVLSAATQPIVVVGGHAFDADPSLVARVGADLCAPDPASAVEMVGALLDSRGHGRESASAGHQP